jgi:hypothetical protein
MNLEKLMAQLGTLKTILDEINDEALAELHALEAAGADLDQFPACLGAEEKRRYVRALRAMMINHATCDMISAGERVALQLWAMLVEPHVGADGTPYVFDLYAYMVHAADGDECNRAAVIAPRETAHLYYHFQRDAGASAEAVLKATAAPLGLARFTFYDPEAEPEAF